MKIKEEKGCVYFFKHSGLTPIKIGYSSNQSPIDRFNQFKTYAPFGAEIIGFILTENASKLESKLHSKFSQYRLEGEWFDISIEIAENEIELQSSIEDLKLKSAFQIEYAKKINERDGIKIEYNNIAFLNKEYLDTNLNKLEFIKLYSNNKRLNKTHFSKVFKVSRKTIHKWIKDFDKLN